MYYIYMLRCKDNSIYTGITTDIDRRMNEHFNQTDKCAKYTLRHAAQKLETYWTVDNRAAASKLEYHIKKVSKINKEELIKDYNNLEKILGEKIESELYKNKNQ